MTKRQDEAAKARKQLMQLVATRVEESNAKAKKRKETAKLRDEAWRKARTADPMIPYVQTGKEDSRPIVEKGPPVRRAYLHTYGFPRSERRVGLAELRHRKRSENRAKHNYLFRVIWESQRARNEAT